MAHADDVIFIILATKNIGVIDDNVLKKSERVIGTKVKQENPVDLLLGTSGERLIHSNSVVGR